MHLQSSPHLSPFLHDNLSQIEDTKFPMWVRILRVWPVTTSTSLVALMQSLSGHSLLCMRYEACSCYTCSMFSMSSQSWSSRSAAISSKYTQRAGIPFPLFMLGSPDENINNLLSRLIEHSCRKWNLQVGSCLWQRQLSATGCCREALPTSQHPCPISHRSDKLLFKPHFIRESSKAFFCKHRTHIIRSCTLTLISLV